MASPKQLYDLVQYIDGYQRRNGRGPSDIEAAAHFRVGRRTIVNWKKRLREDQVIECETKYTSLGRARLRVASWVTIVWERANTLFGSFVGTLKALRAKELKWRDPLENLRRASLVRQRSFLPTFVLKLKEQRDVEVVPNVFGQPERARNAGELCRLLISGHVNGSGRSKSYG